MPADDAIAIYKSEMFSQSEWVEVKKNRKEKLGLVGT